MAGRPLRPATDRRFGGPLPRQLANQTRTHRIPPWFFTPCHAALCAYAVLAAVSGCCPPVYGRLSTRYSPVRHSVTVSSSPEGLRHGASFDLHVLGTPPAFILSQDQTLNLKFVLPDKSGFFPETSVPGFTVQRFHVLWNKNFFLNLSRFFTVRLSMSGFAVRAASFLQQRGQLVNITTM